MTNPQVQAVSNNAQPSILKRVVTTFAPVPTLAYSIGEDLAKGKTCKEAWNEAKTDFKNVHDANKKQFKDNLHNTAEQSREMGAWKYLFGFIPIGVEALDRAINK
jgi:hypothetical protein